jgi:hypothetical protein
MDATRSESVQRRNLSLSSVDDVEQVHLVTRGISSAVRGSLSLALSGVVSAKLSETREARPGKQPGAWRHKTAKQPQPQPTAYSYVTRRNDQCGTFTGATCISMLGHDVRTEYPQVVTSSVVPPTPTATSSTSTSTSSSTSRCPDLRADQLFVVCCTHFHGLIHRPRCQHVHPPHRRIAIDLLPACPRASSVTRVGPRRSCTAYRRPSPRHAPVLSSQTLMVLSSDAERRYLPLGWKTSARIQLS